MPSHWLQPGGQPSGALPGGHGEAPTAGEADSASLPDAARQTGEAEVPPALAEALEENQGLKRALLRSGLPLRFQAMVLGLATLKQAHEEPRAPGEEPGAPPGRS